MRGGDAKLNKLGCSSMSMSDTDALLLLVSGLRGVGCANVTREADGIICKVVNDVDERT
jgi:hypothetical protein